MALTLLTAFLCQGTWALAGTTGGLSGVVTDEAGKPVAGAAVKVTSASQISSTATDATGHYVFLSLAPDTYTISIDKDKYNPISYAGVSVFADQVQTLTFTLHPVLKEIAKVTSTSAGALVRASTTSDVYSINASTAAKVTGLGGGGSLDQAYSAIATMPGAYVPVGQNGWYQSVYIRGGDYDQVGYEVDGVPVNRAFDNYPSNTATSLGQQEVQVYTGAAPSNAEGQGLSGFINQVIKTGTYPGYLSSDLGIGGPAYYHKANIEAGGATPDRLFSYYVGFGGYNQGFDIANSQQGAAYSANWGYPLGNPCPATAPTGLTGFGGCYNGSGTYMGGGATPWYVTGPFNYYNTSFITSRDNVMNFHFAIPHKHDGNRDDLQLLWQGSDLRTAYYSTPGDLFLSEYGNPAYYNTLVYGQATPPAGSSSITSLYNFPESAVYTGQLNQLVPAAGATAANFAPVSNYCFPSAPADLACGGAIPANFGDSVDNAVGIVKLQYQKNFSSAAYLRLYGYTVYSNWFNWGPVSSNLCCAGVPAEYEVYTHTRGLSATFADQLSPTNLLQLQGSYIDANSNRINNDTMFYGSGTSMAVLVNGANPNAGVCYTTTGANGAAGPALAANCDGSNLAALNATNTGKTPYVNSFTVGQLQGGALPAVNATSCGGGPCEWDTVDTGFNGRANTVEPRFTAGSLTDEWDPTDRLHLNFGVRFDTFQYIPSNTLTGAKPFWTSAWNQSYCTDPATPAVAPVPKANTTAPCDDPTNFGAGFVPATITGASSTQTYNVFQPRISGTYTVNPQNVLRLSYGKYDQAPNTAFEQYDALNQNLPDENSNFYTLGFTAPTHPIVPEVSYNTDFSWEHQLKGTDMSFKLTPFYRRTQDQIEQFYLNIQTNFVSGLNIGQQTSKGVEFDFQKGDFSKNGFSGMLSYTYTNAYVTFSPLSNGTTPVSTINQAIAQYNAYTSGCKNGANTAKQYGQAVCAPGVSAGPCYTPATPATATTAEVPGTPLATCAAGDIANPYWNAPMQSFFSPTAQYAPYDLFPAGAPGAGGYGSFVSPNVATLVINYKHGPFAITPALQYSSGPAFGYPIDETGINPSLCTGFLASAVSGDPRYPYGGSGSAYDAGTCAQHAVPVPDTSTKQFDGIGAFHQPNRVTLSMQMTYDFSPHLTAVLTLANLYDGCMGGTAGAWTNVPGVSSSKVCGYGGGYSFVPGLSPVANNYNPPFSSVQPLQQPAYTPSISALPFNAYLDFRLRL